VNVKRTDGLLFGLASITRVTALASGTGTVSK
jgi:hypothetical protein